MNCRVIIHRLEVSCKEDQITSAQLLCEDKSLALQGPDALAVVRPTGIYLLDFFCSGIQFYVLLSLYFCFISFLYLDLLVFVDDALIS